jgi:hypothetical protein
MEPGPRPDKDVGISEGSPTALDRSGFRIRPALSSGSIGSVRRQPNTADLAAGVTRLARRGRLDDPGRRITIERRHEEAKRLFAGNWPK